MALTDDFVITSPEGHSTHCLDYSKLTGKDYCIAPCHAQRKPVGELEPFARFLERVRETCGPGELADMIAAELTDRERVYEADLAFAGRALGAVCTLATLRPDEHLLDPPSHAAVEAVVGMRTYSRNLLTLATNAVNAGGLQVSDRKNELRQFIEGALVTGPGRCEHCGLFLLRDGPIARCPVHEGDYRVR